MPKAVASLSLLNKSTSLTQKCVVITEFVIWLYMFITSESVSLMLNIALRLYSCHDLYCYLWGFDNGTYTWGEGQGHTFSQPFTPPPLRSAATVFGKFKSSLDIRDVLLFVVCLQGCVPMFYHMFEARTGVSRECSPEPNKGAENPNGMQHPKGEREERKVSDATGMGKCDGMQQPQGEKKETKTPDTKVTQNVVKPRGQSKPTEVAPIQKRKCKTKSVRPADDGEEEGPSQTADPEPEIITESLSFDNLRSLRKDISRRSGEPILAWLMRIWSLMGDSLILDGAEARFLGSMATDPGIEQVFARESKPLSLWARLLAGVREKFVYRDVLQEHHHKTAWKTMEEGIQRLREMALLEVLFGREGQATNDPDKVRCTSQMWWSLSRQGPDVYKNFLASRYSEENQETVGAVIGKLRIYEGMVQGPLQARISAVETLVESLRDEQKKLRQEIRESLQVAPLRIRASEVRARRPTAREGGQTSRTELWYFLKDHGEDMRRWDRKPTRVLASRVQELKENERRRSVRVSAVPISNGQEPDPLEGTSNMYPSGRSSDHYNQDQC